MSCDTTGMEFEGVAERCDLRRLATTSTISSRSSTPDSTTESISSNVTTSTNPSISFDMPSKVLPIAERVLSRDYIQSLVDDGRLVFIVDQWVIKADAWIDSHPGGKLAIQHMVGRDATDEVTILHSKQAKNMMRAFRIGRIEGAWKNLESPINLVEQSGHGTASDKEFIDQITQEKLDEDLEKFPSLDTATQDSITQRYRELYTQLEAENLFQCNYVAYAFEIARYSFLFGSFIMAWKSGWYATAGVFLGLFWHQLVFSAHDAGHMGITHNYQVDTTIGIFIADFLGGLSMGWWKSTHNVHHIVTNSPEHDPDIQLLPFFAISHRMFENIFSTYHGHFLGFDAVTKAMIPYQHFMYYVILTFGRFNLYIQSWLFLFGTKGNKKGPARWHRTLEIVGQAFFWYWFGYIIVLGIPTWFDRVVFVLLSHMVTAPLHVQITMSHYGMSTADLGIHESFAQKMLRTTMDVDCPQWLDFIHGGLQFQAVHHLYPRVPRHNLRRVQVLVREFCEDTEIPYAIHGFVKGNKQVIGHLGEVARQAMLLAECQQGVVAEVVEKMK